MVRANPSMLAAGTYSGEITITAISGQTSVQQKLPVTFTVGQLSANPGSITFSYQAGGSLPAAQAISVNAATLVTFNATGATASGGNWLLVNQSSATTPGTVTVSVNTPVLNTLAPASYSGTVTLTPTSGNTLPVQVPVTLTVAAIPDLNISPGALTFNYQINGTNNRIQQGVALSSSGAALNFGVSWSVLPNPAGIDWLTVTPMGGFTPATLNVGISPGALPAGSYTGTIRVTAAGASQPSQDIPVTLNVSANPMLSVSPNALEFAFQIGTAAPAPQTLTPSSTGAELTYSAAASAGGGNWLLVTPSGTTPAPVTVSVNPAGLAAGTYQGTVLVTGIGAGNSPQSVPVTLRVSNDPLITSSTSQLSFNYQIGQAAPVAQALELRSTTGATLNYSIGATTAAGGNWLLLGTTSGSTPGSLTVGASVAGLAAGTYEGTIMVTATNAATGVAAPNSPLSVPVKLYVSASPLLNVSPAALSFSALSGGAAPPAQTLGLSSTSASSTEQIGYTVSFTTQTGGSWLSVNSVGGVTPFSLSVSVAPGLLSAGTYTGTITIAGKHAATGADTANSPIAVPVSLQVTTATLAASPASLSFTQPMGGAAPAAQTVSVTSSGTPLNFSAAANAGSGASWLTVTPAGGTTPGSLQVRADGANLSQGTYQGTITITAPGASGSPQTINVTLTVGAPQTIALSSSSLTYNFQVGGTAPAAQTVQLTSTGGALPFTTAATTSAGGEWLRATPASGNTPAALSIAVDPARLTAGNYTGTVRVASQGASNSPLTINVSLAVAGLPLPVPMEILSAASITPGPVAPGQIIAIKGANMGPATGVEPALPVPGAPYPTTVADTQVLFDGNPAPLLYVSASQINAAVPYTIAGRLSTRVQISYRGTASTPIELRVAEAAPGIFAASMNGTGQGAILNQDYSVNGPNRRAAKGSWIAIYATGEGQTTPAGVSGRRTPLDGSGLARPQLPVSVLIGGRQAQVLYAGSAPGFVAGAFQVNAAVPADAPSGPAVPVVITVGGASSQANVTVAIE
jgi:uncharacterized protein (TIGR03437 family)